MLFLTISIPRPLEIMKYQVGAQDYAACVEAGVCRPLDVPVTAGVPATGVSHIDAEAYAAWYSHMTGEEWRLPTDEEWAYATAEKFVGCDCRLKLDW